MSACGRLAVLITCLVLSLPARAADRAVGPTATGNGSGSDWNNIAAWSFFTPVRGDTYYIASGTYTDATRTFTTAASGTTLIIIKKATIAEHGPATGWSDSLGIGPANFIQDSTSGNVMEFTTSYWTVDGVTGGGPGSWKTGFGFYIDTKRATSPVSGGIEQKHGSGGNLTVRHVEIEGNGGDGAPSSGTNDGFFIGRTNPDALLEFLYIHDQGRVPFHIHSDDFTGRFIWTARNETVSAEHGEAVVAEEFLDTKIFNHTWANCVWEDIEGTGIIVMHVDGADIYGNVFVGEGGEGIGNGGITTWSASDAKNVRVFNNIFIDLPSNKAINFPDSGSTGNVSYNNIFLNAGPGYGNVLIGNRDSNWYFNSGEPWGETNEQDGSGDPFVDYVNDNFHLTANTNAGRSAECASASPDPDGVTRPSTCSRGAYEFQQMVGSLPNPPTNLRVVKIT